LKSSADCPKEVLNNLKAVALVASAKSPVSLASFYNSLSQSAISNPAINILIKP